MSDTSTTRLPLTDAQAGVWYAGNRAGQPVFNVGQYTDIPADLDVDRFIRAVESVVRDSETLRSARSGRHRRAGDPCRRCGVVEIHDLTAKPTTARRRRMDAATWRSPVRHGQPSATPCG